MSAWYEEDELWEVMAPAMFHERRLAIAPDDVENALKWLNLSEGAAVLDLCCGPGRHALELAKRGYAVTGVDRTTAYLERAKRQADTAGVSIEFVQQDMREFCRPETFEGAINLYTSFGYFDDPNDDLRVLQNLHRSLKPGGTLVMEMMGKEVLARNFRERMWDETGGILLLQEPKISQYWSWMDSRWIAIKDGARREFTVSHRIYAGIELYSLLLACGFANVEIYGDLTGIPYDHNARRLVAVARKA